MKTFYPVLVISILLIGFIVPAIHSLEPIRCNTFLVFDTTNPDDFLDVCGQLQNMNFIALHKIPPHVIIHPFWRDSGRYIRVLAR